MNGRASHFIMQTASKRPAYKLRLKRTLLLPTVKNINKIWYSLRLVADFSREK